MAINLIIKQINLIRGESSELQAKLTSLEERLFTLQEVESNVRSFVNIAAVAVPEKNPSVVVTRQLRALAAGKVVDLTEFSILSTDVVTENALTSYEVNFIAKSAEYEPLADFITGLSELLPLVNIGSLNIKSGSASGYEAQVRLLAYSAPYPETLPSLEEALVGLSTEEQESLSLLEQFNAPETAEEASPSEVVPRQNPFSL
jgi:hypothetical protein